MPLKQKHTKMFQKTIYWSVNTKMTLKQIYSFVESSWLSVIHISGDRAGLTQAKQRTLWWRLLQKNCKLLSPFSSWDINIFCHIAYYFFEINLAIYSMKNPCPSHPFWCDLFAAWFNFRKSQILVVDVMTG